jgi:transmembrane sensor
VNAKPLFEDAQLQRMEQAALWLQRMHAATDDERVVDAWLDWCQRDPLNQQAFDEVAAIWELSGRLEAAPATSAAAPVRHARRHLLVASLAGLAVAGGGGAWWLVRQPGELLVSEFSSPIGRNSTQTLGDGSLLELGGGTRVTVSIGRRERRVELHAGELYVNVHHEPARPFSVHVGKLQVVATGTAFNVLRTTEHTTVTVAEGSVKALFEDQGSAAPNVQVQTGYQLVYSQSANNFAVRQADPLNATAWRSGWLHFENQPLGEVIETINRYSASKTVIEDARVRALAVNGNAQIDRIGTWVLALPHLLQVSVTERNGTLLIVPRAGLRPD